MWRMAAVVGRVDRMKQIEEAIRRSRYAPSTQIKSIRQLRKWADAHGYRRPHGEDEKRSVVLRSLQK